jgi:ABC-type nitrate/sulfonate/bicarbonate transport system permease component
MIERLSRRAATGAVPFVVPVVILAVWWILSAGSKSIFWPPLSGIFTTFRHQWLFADVSSELWPTIRRVVEGYVLATVVGVAMGTWLGISRTARDSLTPLLDFARSVPGAALIPPAVLLFGVGDASKVAIVAWISVWPILLNTIDGVTGVEPTLIDLSHAYRFSRRDRIVRVMLPSAAPQIFSGMRIAVSLALLAIVVAELFAATSGLGFVLSEAGNAFDISTMWSTIFALLLISYAANVGFIRLENRVLAWHRGWRAAANESYQDITEIQA